MEESGQHKRLRRPWRQEARREAVLGEARREAALGRREAVLGAGRPVGRPSWAPGGPSTGRLGRRNPAGPAGTKSGQVKIPSKQQYMD